MKNNRVSFNEEGHWLKEFRTNQRVPLKSWSEKSVGENFLS
jgi:hypothetical protein